MTRKIRWNNLALITGVSVFDIACGMYDRIANNSGMLKNTLDWWSSLSHQVSTMPASYTWNATTVNLATSTQSGYSLFSLGILIVGAVGIMGVLFMLVGARAA